MGKKEREPIQVEAFVTINGTETNMDTLPQERRREVGAALKAAWLNALFDGKASFRTEGPKDR